MVVARACSTFLAIRYLLDQLLCHIPLNLIKYRSSLKGLKND